MTGQREHVFAGPRPVAPVKPLPHGPHLVPADRERLATWTEHGVPLDRTTVAALLAIAQTAVAEYDRLLEALTDGPLHVQDQAAAAELLDLIRRRAGNRAQLIELADRAFGGEIR